MNFLRSSSTFSNPMNSKYCFTSISFILLGLLWFDMFVSCIVLQCVNYAAGWHCKKMWLGKFFFLSTWILIICVYGFPIAYWMLCMDDIRNSNMFHQVDVISAIDGNLRAQIPDICQASGSPEDDAIVGVHLLQKHRSESASGYCINLVNVNGSSYPLFF